jgi:hypothetical protein
MRNRLVLAAIGLCATLLILFNRLPVLAQPASVATGSRGLLPRSMTALHESACRICRYAAQNKPCNTARCSATYASDRRRVSESPTF